jgi:hypothetical protein
MLPLTWIMSSKACALADATDNCASQWAQTGGFSHQHNAALDRARVSGLQGFRSSRGSPQEAHREERCAQHAAHPKRLNARLCSPSVFSDVTERALSSVYDVLVCVGAKVDCCLSELGLSDRASVLLANSLTSANSQIQFSTVSSRSLHAHSTLIPIPAPKPFTTFRCATSSIRFRRGFRSCFGSGRREFFRTVLRNSCRVTTVHGTYDSV